MEALAGNRALRTFDCSGINISRGFARDVILPAMRVNATQRKLQFVFGEEDVPELAEGAAGGTMAAMIFFLSGEAH